MGDQGGKKDKDKSQKQKAEQQKQAPMQQKQEVKGKPDKNRPKTS
jgi:hypothetical protein